MGSSLSKSTYHQLVETQSFRKKYVSSDLKITYEDLQPIDEHALQVPESVTNSINELADYLAKPSKSELQTIRSFYVWICYNISYTVTAEFGAPWISAATEPVEVLKCKSSEDEGYARLFQALCLAKNIKCKTISGFAKDYSYQLGTIFSYQNKTNHFWNVVFVSGKWRMIETTWGAGYVDDDTKAFVQKSNNFFFLTNPELFIEDHFPYIDSDVAGSKYWQLIKCPVSLKDFSKASKTTIYAKEWGVEFPFHKFEVVKVDRKASIAMISLHHPLARISVKLYDSTGELFNKSVVIVKENITNYTITITSKGIKKYILRIFGTVDQSHNLQPMLTSYKIECTSTEDELVHYPKHKGS